jgi:hypothetical protein
MDSYGLSDFLHDLQGRVVPENSQSLWYSRECLTPATFSSRKPHQGADSFPARAIACVA